MDDRKRDGETNSTLRTKEQGSHLTLNEHDDDDDDDDDVKMTPNTGRNVYEHMKITSLSFNWQGWLAGTLTFWSRNFTFKF